MFNYISQLYAVERCDLISERVLRLFMYDLVVTNKLYKILKYPFHVEARNSLGGKPEYIPLRERRPSAPLNICKIVVDSCASLLFGENHFPQIHMKDASTRNTIKDISKNLNFNKLFEDILKYGSIGSVAVLIGVIDKQLFVTPKKTVYLEPEFDNENTRNLVRVVEKYQTSGQALRTIGYPISEDELAHMFWFKREWTIMREIYYVPWLVKCVLPEAAPVVDEKRSYNHDLGFVPIVWIRNLSGGDLVDGVCTFDCGIETMIERDYLMSQGGRGLRYTSDPLLLVKSDSLQLDEPYIKSADNAMVVPKDGDAKLLEITGGAMAALESFAKVLREQALESIHGNRSDSNKLSVAQSGRAMEMMNQDLVWLCESLRNCYGVSGLVKVVEMILKIVSKTTILIQGKKIDPIKADENVVLIWPSWYAATPDDLQKTAQAVAMFRQSNVLSQETAIRTIAPIFDIEDVSKEVSAIDADDDLDAIPSGSNLDGAGTQSKTIKKQNGVDNAGNKK